MFQLSEFVWTLRSSAWAVLNNFLLIDATDRSKISSDQKPLFFAVSLYPLSFFTNTLFNLEMFLLKSSKANFENIWLNFPGIEENVIAAWKP